MSFIRILGVVSVRQFLLMRSILLSTVWLRLDNRKYMALVIGFGLAVLYFRGVVLQVLSRYRKLGTLSVVWARSGLVDIRPVCILWGFVL